MKRSYIFATVSAFALVFAGASGAFAQQVQQSQPTSGQDQLDIQSEHETLDTKPLTRDEAHRLINTYGYTKIEDLEKKGDKFTATAEKDGKRKNLVVDARQGSVREAGS